jgi:hypothetical protein
VNRLPLLLLALGACIPPGNSTGGDAGPAASAQPTAPPIRPSFNVMTAPFEDNFERAAPAKPDAAAVVVADAKAEAEAQAEAAPLLEVPAKAPDDPGPDWLQSGTTAWRIEKGKLCGQGAKNHGIWLNKTLPVNARIEFDATSDSPDGDLKVEVWGDGRSAATGVSYTNATSYLIIYGGWKNTTHAIARINEHGKDRKEIHVDKTSDDPRQRAVNPGQTYHFKIERTDAKTVRWFVDGVEMLSFRDEQPLLGMGHDHFAFNDWDAHVCFDNVKVTPL